MHIFGYKSVEQKNAHILALFIFQYSLLIPFMMFFSSTLLVAITSILLVLATLFHNSNKRGAICPLCILAIIALIIFVKSAIYGRSIKTIITFLSISFPATVVCLYKIDYNEFWNYISRLSILNFIAIFWYPFVRIDYMRFGYGILLSCMGLYVCLFQQRNVYKDSSVPVVHGIVFFLSIIELVLYGARGATLSFALLIIIDYLVIRIKIKKILTLGSLAIIVILNFERLLLLLENIADGIGIGSRAIMKYRLLIVGADVDLILSGRIGYYQAALEKFRMHPILGGVIDFMNEQYAHNIVLDIMKDLGLIGLTFFIVFVIAYYFSMRNKKGDKALNTILGFLFSLSMGRLLFSSSIWLRPEFWILIAFYFSRFHVRTSFSFGRNSYSIMDYRNIKIRC